MSLATFLHLSYLLLPVFPPVDPEAEPSSPRLLSLLGGSRDVKGNRKVGVLSMESLLPEIVRRQRQCHSYRQ